ncbi:hypothetical protein [Paenibacillus spongiae]|uniref:Uncharacterized protein n=1 Tax=Paenibacillus spongiae TaxID=2909671 RepID=A0ABY5S6W2_9BACL|nr:hypothetical protein [Paenibacillus spongiae]UVI29642.1 hypothetical protein L1F29_30220 [Paenibacillus spongiae]
MAENNIVFTMANPQPEIDIMKALPNARVFAWIVPGRPGEGGGSVRRAALLMHVLFQTIVIDIVGEYGNACRCRMGIVQRSNKDWIFIT